MANISEATIPTDQDQSTLIPVLSGEIEVLYDDDEEINAPPKTLIDKIIDDFWHRSGQVQKSREQFASGEITLPEHVLHSYGKGGALMTLDVVGDVLISGLGKAWEGIGKAEEFVRWVMPDEMEESIYFGEKVADNLTNWYLHSEEAQQGIQAAINTKEDYLTWADEHPRAAANLESVLGIALLFTPLPKGKGKVKTDEPYIQTTAFGNMSKTQKHLAKQQVMRNKYDKLWEQLNFSSTGKPVRITDQNVGRVTVEGKFTQMQTINYNTYEKEFMDTLFQNGVKTGYIHSPSRNAQAISQGIERVGSQVEKELVSYHKFPLTGINPQSIKKSLTDNLNKLIKENPVYVNSPRNQQVMEDNLAVLFGLIDSGKFAGTPHGVWKLRQAFDDLVEGFAGKGKLDPTIPISAMDDSTRLIRHTLNDVIIRHAPNVRVEAMFKELTHLYKGRGMIKNAVNADAVSTMHRVWKTLANLITLKMAYNRTMAVALGASAYGVAGQALGYSSIIAMGAGGIAAVGGIAIQTKTTKILLGKTLAYMDQAMKVAGNPEVIKSLAIDRAFVKELFERPIEKGEPEEGV